MGELSVGAADGALVAAARAGDETAFRRLTEPYRRELHVHCYRMLGSLHDAEDLLQETFLRAWTRLDSYEGRAPFRAWLYRIATNACLNELRRRKRQLPPRALGPAADPTGEHVAFAAEVAHLEPYPDDLYDEARAAAVDPQARYLARETIQLAFLTAVQLLPPRQRAVLILREVLGFTASEVADVLETSVPAANSALQRARAAIAAHAPIPDAIGLEDAAGDRELLERFVHAFEDGDVPALAALLHDDVVLTMPPAPSWYAGREAVGRWFATSPFAFGDPARRFRLVAVGANRQPAYAAYAWNGEAGRFAAYGVMVLRLEGGLVSDLTGFAGEGLFAHFGLPEEIAA